ncbi:MAG: hypothetical protein IPK82_20075 [Polyangiaceae bacterium]|nr:hypothetical protein [Polyangiaceae bacterium]
MIRAQPERESNTVIYPGTEIRLPVSELEKLPAWNGSVVVKGLTDAFPPPKDPKKRGPIKPNTREVRFDGTGFEFEFLPDVSDCEDHVRRALQPLELEFGGLDGIAECFGSQPLGQVLAGVAYATDMNRSSCEEQFAERGTLTLRIPVNPVGARALLAQVNEETKRRPDTNDRKLAEIDHSRESDTNSGVYSAPTKTEVGVLPTLRKIIHPLVLLDVRRPTSAGKRLDTDRGLGRRAKIAAASVVLFAGGSAAAHYRLYQLQQHVEVSSFQDIRAGDEFTAQSGKIQAVRFHDHATAQLWPGTRVQVLRDPKTPQVEVLTVKSGRLTVEVDDTPVSIFVESTGHGIQAKSGSIEIAATPTRCKCVDALKIECPESGSLESVVLAAVGATITAGRAAVEAGVMRFAGDPANAPSCPDKGFDEEDNHPCYVRAADQPVRAAAFASPTKGKVFRLVTLPKDTSVLDDADELRLLIATTATPVPQPSPTALTTTMPFPTVQPRLPSPEFVTIHLKGATDGRCGGVPAANGKVVLPFKRDQVITCSYRCPSSGNVPWQSYQFKVSGPTQIFSCK